MSKNLIITTIAALFVLLFTYAAVSKLIDYHNFRLQLGMSPLLTRYADFVSWFIPFVEIIIALLLFFENSRLAGLYASFSLMVVFTSYIVAITKFSEFIPCSCGGVLQNMSWDQHIVFNIIFILLALAGIVLQGRREIARVHGFSS